MINIVDIDNRQVREYTKALRKMHKSDLPIVVRQTLNDMAFDVKQNTLGKQYSKQFVKRNKSFLKSQSGVQKADGFSVNSMYAEVGITPSGSGGEAAEGLTKQEYGGTKVKPFVYMRNARGGSNRRLVQGQKYVNKYQKIKGNPSVSRRTRKSNFIAAAIMAHRTGKLLIWDTKSGQTVFLINSIYLGAGKAVSVNATPIADYEKSRSIKLKARPFLQPAAKISYQKQEMFFIKNANKRLNKYIK